MTPDQITQLRQLITEIKQHGCCGYAVDRLNRILALLPCSTCNGTKKTGTGIGEDGRDFDMRSPEILEPCPDCK